jgi:menaquinone-dependent protoporphyrinogen IX oxidase
VPARHSNIIDLVHSRPAHVHTTGCRERITATLLLITKEDTRCQAGTYLDQLQEKAPAVEPVDRGLFGGAMDYKKLPLPLRLMMKAMKKKEGDFRDWEAIRAWAMGLRSLLSGA